MGLTYALTRTALWAGENPERVREDFIDLKVMTQDEIDSVYAEVNAALDEAVDFAEQSPYPDPSVLLDDVYWVGGD